MSTHFTEGIIENIHKIVERDYDLLIIGYIIYVDSSYLGNMSYKFIVINQQRRRLVSTIN